jgi:hypothetical protein
MTKIIHALTNDYDDKTKKQNNNNNGSEKFVVLTGYPQFLKLSLGERRALATPHPKCRNMLTQANSSFIAC